VLVIGGKLVGVNFPSQWNVVVGSLLMCVLKIKLACTRFPSLCIVIVCKTLVLVLKVELVGI
jgi:hypothetical protein